MLIEEFRGALVENVHGGRICVVDENGKVLASVGDANTFTYFRSVAKPFQLLPLIMRGIDAKFSLTSEELAVCAASHLGEDCHIRVLENIMKKADLKEDDLVMKPTIPGHSEARERFIKNGLPPRKLYHNCSGKHLALMMLQRELTGSVNDYFKLGSEVQNEMIGIISTVSNFPSEQIICGIDGCGVPVFGVPLKNIAIAFNKLGCQDNIKDRLLVDALKRVAASFSQHPYMTRGHGQLCGEINTLENIVAKSGAEGVYALSLKKEKLGIAFKIADGSTHTWPLVIAEILRQLGYKDEKTFALLESLKNKDKFNDNGDKIGYYRPVFRLV